MPRASVAGVVRGVCCEVVRALARRVKCGVHGGRSGRRDPRVFGYLSNERVMKKLRQLAAQFRLCSSSSTSRVSSQGSVSSPAARRWSPLR
jgi:hypothetical protein